MILLENLHVVCLLAKLQIMQFRTATKATTLNLLGLNITKFLKVVSSVIYSDISLPYKATTS